MPRLFLYDYPPQPLILSVEDSVGRGGANRRLDVMLVQFFLHVTAQNDERSWGWTIDRKITKPEIDGICGPITQGWIDRFQDVQMRREKASRMDALTLSRGQLHVTRQGLPLTMYMLNVYYYGTFGANAILRVANHPLMPRELASTFAIHGRGIEGPGRFWI